MDAVQGWASPPASSRAVEFTGHWKEYLPIAVTNLLLTIVTLGIYRFWAKARERRYLWSRTRLIDDYLEWTGTGGEMFVGFLMAMGVLFGSLAVIFGGGALLGNWFAVVGMVAFYIFLLWAFGFAQFRALRYRLSRTWWRGIRGGSDDNGVGYGWTALGNNFVAGLTLGILTPRAIAENWNDRVRKMSFGPHMLDSNVDTHGLQIRWMMLYAVYIGFFGLTFLAAPSAETEAEPTLSLILAPVALLVGLVLVMTSFWALFFRKAADTFAMGELRAGFEVSSVEWLKFYAKLIGLTIVTLGLGSIMWGYLRWKFVFDRLVLYGTVDLDTMTQSTTASPKDAEGFADAFDVGAF
jgi:uncharacterized membrane protein YjgN (DUF898 family)